ncbi:hypothetical protein [Jiella avicenniae]|uniref:Uncharacterized protein n=1 Tax=Jiella avicenniae TaxID=2907202 RepID=A0A9X1P2E5_9HYPH|nr:hypothetical protein [Jiella avicenniae]MCE7028098.1 hypothetical protein [Jiella avicenniae]
MAFVETTALEIVNAAIAVGESLGPDPMLGEMSSLASMLRSVISRVGKVIPDVIAEVLRQDPALTVLREYPLPMTQAATELVTANRRNVVATLPHDLHVIGTWAADLVVIDETTRHASIHEVKRGGCVFSGTRCAETINRLRIVALTARRALLAAGYDVASVSVSVIDRYGKTGHEPTMTVGPDEIDAAFGVPSRRFLDHLDETVRAALLHRMGPAIRQLAATLSPDTGPTDVDEGDDRDGGASSGAAVDQDRKTTGRDACNAGLSLPPVDLSRFIGIAERRRQSGLRRMH